MSLNIKFKTLYEYGNYHWPFPVLPDTSAKLMQSEEDGLSRWFSSSCRRCRVFDTEASRAPDSTRRNAFLRAERPGCPAERICC
ncbi:hypothetical protein B0O95_104200 [Mycetohabitans endofungorum]|uniref:Uncharacterized protein n=1 Tax=Mycetohabitans endofungorum TaxID=417203 RepID=A0A2P5KC06_9BURK|nr:hypothetical protein B0O95_104200 [Mycetohabitans endofungorum]